MRTVYKYKLDIKHIGDPFKMKLPMSAKIVKVEAGCIWAEVYTEHSLEDHEFIVYGTGMEIAARDKHIGTWLEPDKMFGPFVWHLYERF
jgi:hypothetical protein